MKPVFHCKLMDSDLQVDRDSDLINIVARGVLGLLLRGLRVHSITRTHPELLQHPSLDACRF